MSDLTPDDALDAIHALTASLERLGRLSRWQLLALGLELCLTGVLLFASTFMFVASARAHAAHTEALRLLIQEHRVLLDRSAR
jgi:hypothetical protein